MRHTLFLFILVLPVVGLASPAEEPEETRIPILETTREFFGVHANAVANRLDMFFADQRADDELARSRIRLRQQYEIRERSLPLDEFQFRFNLRLPHLEEKFKIEFEEEVKKKKVKKEGKKEAVRNELNRNWQYRADVGVNASIPPNVVFRQRVRKNFSTGAVIHRFVEELSWFSDRDWEQETTFDSDLSLAEELLLRFRHTVDWKVTRKDFKTNHGPSLLHRVTDDDAFSYGLSLTSVVESIWWVSNYRISTTYRRNLYKQWIYLNVTPGLDFPKEWSFRRTPFIFFQLEALFGGY